MAPPGARERFLSVTNLQWYPTSDRCGSTYPEVLRRAVLRTRLILGLPMTRCRPLDAIDERGSGRRDMIMVICALHLQRSRKLQPPKIVATVMSNIGLISRSAARTLKWKAVRLGRYVLKRCSRPGPSGRRTVGHIIFLNHATTGDGLLSALKLVEVMKTTGLPLSELARRWKNCRRYWSTLSWRTKRPFSVMQP